MSCFVHAELSLSKHRQERKAGESLEKKMLFVQSTIDREEGTHMRQQARVGGRVGGGEGLGAGAGDREGRAL